MNGRSSIRFLPAAVGIALALVSAPAHALQSLAEFLDKARTESLDNREAVELSAQRSAEVDQAWGRILPALSARAAYTRNQFPVEPPLGPGGSKLLITPENQLDATITLDVPIIDVAGWKRIGAARALSDAADVRKLATGQEVDRSIAQRYYQVVAAEALLDAAQRTLKAAEESRKVVVMRRDAGAATELDAERAQAEIERAKQSEADAELLRTTSRRALESQSGLPSTPGGQPFDADLTEEAPLAQWLSGEASALPAVRAAELETRAADRNGDAAKAALLPVISATSTERFTNATGFAGIVASNTAGFVATWRLDFALIGAARAQDAAARGAAVREGKAKLAASDKIHDAWQQVRAQIAKSRAARSQSAASAHAAALAQERYASGAGTQLDLIQAQRDAFGAEVARVQADADLAYARMLLRLSANKTPQRGAVR